jgi:hypothetical protein
MTVKIEIREETAAKLQAIADALHLSLDDYLAGIAALVPLHQANGEQRALEGHPLRELLDGLVGVIDSSVPDSDPSAQSRHTLFGQLLVEKFRKQGLKLP